MASAVAAGALLAVGASQASAQEWSVAGPVELAGELVVEVDGGSPVACQFSREFGAYGSMLMSDFGYEWDACETGWLGWEFMWAVPVDGTTVEFPTGIGDSPHGSFDPTTTGPFQGTVVNGSGSVPTQILLEDAPIGRQLGGPGQITVTGVLDVTTPTGGLVTYE